LTIAQWILTQFGVSPLSLEMRGRRKFPDACFSPRFFSSTDKNIGTTGKAAANVSDLAGQASAFPNKRTFLLA